MSYLGKETYAGALFVLLLLAFADPLMVFMPTPLFYCISALFIATAALFVGLILRERPQDEREEAHIRQAGRVGYLLGTLVLTLGVVVESMVHHTVDPWLLVALGALIVGKFVTYSYLTRHDR